MKDEKDLSGTGLTEGVSVSVSAPADAAPHAASTPGPWEVQTHVANENINRVMPVFRRDNIGKLPAWEGNGFYIKNKADAHLIAAAPELKEALKHAIGYLRMEAGPDVEFIQHDNGSLLNLAKLDAAIAKAEGR